MRFSTWSSGKCLHLYIFKFEVRSFFCCFFLRFWGPLPLSGHTALRYGPLGSTLAALFFHLPQWSVNCCHVVVVVIVGRNEISSCQFLSASSKINGQYEARDRKPGSLKKRNIVQGGLLRWLFLAIDDGVGTELGKAWLPMVINLLGDIYFLWSCWV